MQKGREIAPIRKDQDHEATEGEDTPINHVHAHIEEEDIHHHHAHRAYPHHALTVTERDGPTAGTATGGGRGVIATRTREGTAVAPPAGPPAALNLKGTYTNIHITSPSKS